tara:strand:+ start:67 stop:1059 length:993 start_codon:yes stop_codon:yes gene_type:complete
MATTSEEVTERVVERIEELSAEKESILVQLAEAENAGTRKTLTRALKDTLEELRLLREGINVDVTEGSSKPERIPKIPKRVPAFPKKEGPAQAAAVVQFASQFRYCMEAEGIKPNLWGRMLLTLAPTHMAPSIQEEIAGRDLTFGAFVERLLIMAVGPSYKGELYSALISGSQGSDKVMDYHARVAALVEALGLNAEPCNCQHACGLESTLTSNAVAAYSFTRGLRHEVRKGLTVRFSDVSQHKLSELAQHAQAIEQSCYQGRQEARDREAKTRPSGSKSFKSKENDSAEKGSKRKPEDSKEVQEKKRRRKEGLCFKCGKDGHMARDCQE